MRRSSRRARSGTRAAAAAAVLFVAACAGDEADPTPDAELEAFREHGRGLFTGRGGCIECHKVGPLGDRIRGPDLGQGRRTAAYVATSIVDPEAAVFEGYAGGVMKPPDEPPVSLTDDEIVSLALFISGEDDREGARAAIVAARKAREHRSRRRRVDHVLGKVPWDEGDSTRGAELFRDLGCALCHDNPRNPETHAPCLHVAAARLSRENMARWLLAPPRTKMPSYERILGPAQIADLTEFLQRELPGQRAADHAAAAVAP